jgi:hypothetical protein
MNFSRIKIDNELLELYNTDIFHFQNSEDWKINVFFYFADSEKLNTNWLNVSSSISAIYQSEIKSTNEFEKWNIYLIYLSNDIISKELKNKIENNRFSNRKIVEDNFQSELNDEKANELIIKHITNTDLIKVISETNISIQEVYLPINENLWKLIPKDETISGDTDKQKDLLELLKQLENEN